jgi:hypothetical protein
MKSALSACRLFGFLFLITPATAAEPPGFRPSPWFGEFVKERGLADGVRAWMNLSQNYDAKLTTRLVIYATPNGNSIEWTAGRATAKGEDWHFDIQHAAAQVRRLRELSPNENVALAVIEAEGLSWPAWKKRTAEGPKNCRAIVDELTSWLPAGDIRVTLTGHSGGGSFLFGVIDGGGAVPESVDRIVFLDANYSFSGSDGHAKKLLTWLNAKNDRRLIVVAYDDREITLDGKKVVGPDGGTFRATGRMRTEFGKDVVFTELKSGPFDAVTALNGRIAFSVHPNPENKILHTALVGEMNGLLRGLTDGGDQSWDTFGGPRAYTKWVSPVPAIPARPTGAVSGPAFIESVATVPRAEREAKVAKEVVSGNLPAFLRTFKPVTVTAKDRAGKVHTAVFEVMPDYLAIGSDESFVRMPMSPQTALFVADRFDCCLPTRKMVDDAFKAATVKLHPLPLTEAREAPATFHHHNRIIENQRTGKPLGELVAGIKKDVVVSNRLGEKPNRVGIYGWHHPNGKPIQTLNVAHVNWYVDYSHCIRLVKRMVLVDGKPRDVRQVLASPDLCTLLSDEGPLLFPAY